MDLKFSFSGASPDQHDHGDAPSGIPLPFAGATTALGSTSSVLEIRVVLDGSAVVAEARSGDGVSYAKATRPLVDHATSSIAAGVRSAVSRAGAELGEPLVSSVSALVLALGAEADSAAVLAALGCDAVHPTVTDALQSRTGITAGTPLRVEPGSAA